MTDIGMKNRQQNQHDQIAQHNNYRMKITNQNNQNLLHNINTLSLAQIYIDRFKMNKNSILLSLLLVTLVSADYYYKYYVDNPDALCLDGSKSDYYVQTGNLQKWVIYFQSTAKNWCGSSIGLTETLESCYLASKQKTGSSKNDSNMFAFIYGIMAEEDNNQFKDWTRVYIRYCTGTGHQGYRKDPIKYKDTSLYFRGHNTTIGVLNNLVSKHNFNFSQKVVVTGDGFATYLWTQYIAAFVKKWQGTVWAIPDSGIVLDEANYKTLAHNYKQKLINAMKLSNVDTDLPNSACVQAYPNQVWKCLFAQYSHEFISAPLFAVESAYNQWSLREILGVSCVKNHTLTECYNMEVLDYVEEYHQKTTAVLQKLASNPKNGFWSPVCADFSFISQIAFLSSNYTIPAKSVNLLSKSIADWMNKTPGNHSHLDSGNWPSNRPCSGLSNNFPNLKIQ